MKRFHSNLQKIHALCEQQSRMARIEMLRRKSLLDAAQLAHVQAQRDFEQARTTAAEVLRRPIQTSVILGMQNHLTAMQERVSEKWKACLQAEKDLRQAQEAYRELDAKVEKLAQLIQRQYAEYRKNVLKEQQLLIDDLAVLRWSRPDQIASEVTSHD